MARVFEVVGSVVQNVSDTASDAEMSLLPLLDQRVSASNFDGAYEILPHTMRQHHVGDRSGCPRRRSTYQCRRWRDLDIGPPLAV